MEEDVGAVERSFRDTAPRLWRSLVLFSGNADLADDALAEAYAQALARVDEIRDIDAWVWKAAFKIARGDLKRMRTSGAAVPENLPVELPLQTVDLVRAMRSLSVRQRQALILHHYAGYSLREVARVIGTTQPAVAMLLDRGRKKLRPLLEDHDVEPT